MKRWAVLLLLVVPWVAGAGDSTDREGHPGGKHPRFDEPKRWVEVWEDPGRAAWQKVSTIFRLLGIREGMKVADLGAGTGYFVKPLSIAVREAGKVYAVDVEPAMVEFMKNRVELNPLGNVVTVLAEPDDPKLPEGELDLILVVNTWHHVEHRVDYIRGLTRFLRPGKGRVAIIDWRTGELPVGPPDAGKVARETVIAEFEKAGWTHTTESIALPYQYFLVFHP